MYKKLLLAAVMLGSALTINASDNEIVNASKCDTKPLETQNVQLNKDFMLELGFEKNTVELTPQLMAVTCNQCYVDHQVCIQNYSRPFCRQQLADCRETCQ